MKIKLIMFSLLLGATVTGPAVHAAEADITPVVRSESAILLQIQALQAQIDKVRQLMAASVITADAAWFTISIDENEVVSKAADGMTVDSAQAQCEAVAYNTDNMWKLVTCTFDGDELYKDVFIAG